MKDEKDSKRTSGKNNLKSLVMAGTAVLTYTCGAMYVGDKVDVQQNFTTPVRDWAFQTETADDFAPYDAIDLVTIVNEEGERETFLKYDRIDGGFEQLSPIDDRGYAGPDGLGERLDNYIQRNKEALEDTKAYGKMDRLREKVDLGIKYYSMKVKEFFDNVF